MNVLGIITARRGSRGVPGKCVRELLDKPVIYYTIDAAIHSAALDKIAVTTDDPEVKNICAGYESKALTVIDRPVELADDKARIDDVMRHCCLQMETRYEYKPDIVVLLYANIPVRADGIIDKTIDHLIKTGADSVQTLAPVEKFHPYWLYKLDGDRATKYNDNQIYQRQDLPPLYYIDGAVGAMSYDVLSAAAGSENPHAFWGQDRRGITQQPHETVDIDTYRDLLLAEATLRAQQQV